MSSPIRFSNIFAAKTEHHTKVLMVKDGYDVLVNKKSHVVPVMVYTLDRTPREHAPYFYARAYFNDIRDAVDITERIIGYGSLQDLSVITPTHTMAQNYSSVLRDRYLDPAFIAELPAIYSAPDHSEIVERLLADYIGDDTVMDAADWTWNRELFEDLEHLTHIHMDKLLDAARESNQMHIDLYGWQSSDEEVVGDMTRGVVHYIAHHLPHSIHIPLTF